MMKKIFLSLLLFLILAFTATSQCEVSSIQIDGTIYRYSMSENFYKNEDLENGLKSIYFHTNTYKDKITKKISLIDIVVTYVYSGYQASFTPNKLSISLSNSSLVTLKANEKSTNTLNQTKSSPAGIKTIEGIFEISTEDANKIISNTISNINLEDSREGNSLNVTPKYKGLLSEMLSCTNNK